ncbi:hypothetical protein SAMN05444487_11930 [Marininema mesophilum]|uniref:Uncharacterized protein n=1 Tax=Marininema mesophilum TaxID=1048340 RepID=A0A1H3C1P1_9BACL|nr:hypothetical protein [Marininema mesophilum]SDX48077.1 hypothetical protein SAMN05444487_11930 [Marininema mesophilum]
MKQHRDVQQDSGEQQRKQAEAKDAENGIQVKADGAGDKKLEGPDRPST